MNHAGEIAPLSRLVRPHTALITTIAPAHTEAFPSLDAVADAKAEIFEGLEPGGTAVLNRDNVYFERLATAACTAGAGSIVSFGESADADARLLDWRPAAAGGTVTAAIDGDEIDYEIAFSGRHWALNSVAVLACVQAAGASGRAGRPHLAHGRARGGPGRAPQHSDSGRRLRADRRELQRKPGGRLRRDQNARRNSAVCPRGRGGSRSSATCWRLGEEGPRWHAELAGDLEAAGIDLVFTTGPLMAHLHRALGAARRGAHAPESESLTDILRAEIRAGDVVLVKGSLGSRMGPIVRRLAADASAARRP